MRFLKNDNDFSPGDFRIGGKAANLFALKHIGLQVPRFVVLPAESLEEIVPEEQRTDISAIRKLIGDYSFAGNFFADLDDFPDNAFFAVRSSAVDEDGSDFSFAGQFESYLFVTRNTLAEHIKKVWLSAFSDRVSDYRRHNRLIHSFGIAVVVQEMIPAEAAGVAFGINPSSGDRGEKVISAVFGLGEGLVSGELDADNFRVKDGQIVAEIALKTEQVVFDRKTGGGTITIPVEKERQNQRTMSDRQVLEIAALLDKTALHYGKPQDMEFAWYNDQLYLLQARPITNLHKIADQFGEYILWDNSNIIESYPGVTTPLTFSFISRSYEGAYKLFSRYLGVSKKTIAENERVFANTLGLINGRVYYNLKTWYHMLAMLPGYSINARFMESMMGVKERFDVPGNYRLSRFSAWLSILKMAAQMYVRFLSLPRKRRAFMKLLDATISRYKNIDLSKKNANELMQLYFDFEKTLLNEWKAPLLNDFFAMIWFGMLQKRTQKYRISDNPNIHNDLLCGSSDIISVQPIHRTIAIATQVNADKKLEKLFRSNDEKTIWQRLQSSDDEAEKSLLSEIQSYIHDFGERCIGELKLESVSYNQDPTRFVKVVKSYVENGITSDATSGKTEEQIRSRAENEVNKALRGKWRKKRKLAKTLRKARELVSARENLRYERTRAFGIVRELFSHIGRRFYFEGIIENERDIFYLAKEEIFGFIEGTAVTQNLEALISLRKEEFAAYRNSENPVERFATYGPVYHANDFFSTGKMEVLEGDLKGIGCCPGRVRGKVRVVADPNEISSLNGDILVTSSTDPGWVTLFPSASAIIVERGSLLSHSAIVSREMGKPCIVSVTGLLKTLKTGDEIEMDGSTGEIRILEKLHND